MRSSSIDKSKELYRPDELSAQTLHRAGTSFSYSMYSTLRPLVKKKPVKLRQWPTETRSRVRLLTMGMQDEQGCDPAYRQAMCEVLPAAGDGLSRRAGPGLSFPRRRESITPDTSLPVVSGFLPPQE